MIWIIIAIVVVIMAIFAVFGIGKFWKIVIITTGKENIAPIVKNIEEIIAINKAAIPL